jgi:hypothetical protein
MKEWRQLDTAPEGEEVLVCFASSGYTGLATRYGAFWVSAFGRVEPIAWQPKPKVWP